MVSCKCKKEGHYLVHTHTHLYVRLYLPVACEPYRPPRGPVDYICSSWKTLIVRQQQTPGVPGIACSPASPIKYHKDIYVLPAKPQSLYKKPCDIAENTRHLQHTLMVLRSMGYLMIS